MRAVRESYLEILKRWPVPNEQMRVPTRQGETFVIARGEKKAMPLLLFHGSGGNSAMWMGDTATSPAARYFMEFLALIHENFRPRIVKLPMFSDEALQRLTMPVVAILGGKDVLLDSAGTKRRLERNLSARRYPLSP